MELFVSKLAGRSHVRPSRLQDLPKLSKQFAALDPCDFVWTPVCTGLSARGGCDVREATTVLVNIRGLCVSFTGDNQP